MTVWIVERHYHYDDSEVVSVHTTRETSIAKVKKLIAEDPNPYTKDDDHDSWHGYAVSLCIYSREVEP